MSGFLYAIREAWRGLWYHRAVSVNSLFSLTGALIVPAVFLVVWVNATGTLREVEDRRQMVVFLMDDVPDSTLTELQAHLQTPASTITHVTREDAWREMRSELGGSDLLEAVGENPLPASLRLTLRPGYRRYEAMDSLALALVEHAAVEDVVFGGEAVRTLDEIIDTLRWTGIGIAGVIALVLFFVVANTIRLTILSRDEVHRILALLGAGGMFMRLPLFLEGILATLLASLLALGITYALYLGVAARLPILPSFLPVEWMVAFVLAAALVGGLGSFAALIRFRKEIRGE